MASLTRSQLKTSSNSTYDTNGVGGITAAEVRTFNDDLIDSLITNDLTGAMSVASASNALTASSVASTVLASLNSFSASALVSISNLNASSASQQVSINSLNAATGSYAISASVAAVDAAQQQQINSLIAASSSYANSASFAASQLVQDGRLNNLESTSASLLIETSNLELFSASALVSINALNTNSGSVNTSISNLNSATQSLQGQLTTIGGQSGSWITESETGSFAITGSNIFRGNQTITGSLLVSGSDVEFRIVGNSVINPYFGLSGINATLNATDINMTVQGDVKINNNVSGRGLQLSGGDPLIGLRDTSAPNNPFIALTNRNNRLEIIDTTSTIVTMNTASFNIPSASFTASLQQGYVWVGDSTGKSIAVATSSFGGTTDLSSLNSFTASQYVSNSFFASTASLNSYTQSTNIRLNNLETTSASVNVSISNLNSTTASQGVSITNLNASSASQQISIDALNTFTASQSTASLVTSITNLNTFSASALVSITNINSATQSLQAQLTTIGGQSGSWITESETSSFARTNVDNNFSVNQTFTNITAVSASITYLTTLYETASVIYSSGSNQLGDELTDIQTLSGSVKVQGSLTVNGTPVLTSSVDISGLTTTASFNSYTQSNNQRVSSLETNSASVNTSVSNINTFTQSANISINALNAATSSYATSAITASSLITASVNLNTITFTKGDASTFAITVNTGSGGGGTTDTGSLMVTGSVAGNVLTFTKGNASTFTLTVATGSGGGTTDITALNAFTASQYISNSFFATTGSNAFSGSNTFNGNFSIITDPNVSNVIISASADNNNDRKVLSVLNGTAIFPNSGSNFQYDGIAIGARSGSNTSAAVAEFAVDYNSGPSLFWTPNRSDSANNNRIRFTSLNNVTQSVQVSTGLFQLFNNGSRDIADSGKVISFPIVPGTDGQYLRLVDSNGTVGFSTFSSGSFATTGSNTFTGNQLIDKNGGEFQITDPSNPNRGTTAIGISGASGGLIFKQSGSALIEGSAGSKNLTFYGTGSFNKGIAISDDDFTAGATIRYDTTNDVIIIEKDGVYKPSLNIEGGLTASLQQGYAWVGNASGRTSLVATSSFGGGGAINTGSFATTGSNTFTGDQTLIDNAGNFYTISDASGSMMLVAKGFTSASAHISASSAGIGNFIFKTNDNTADTIISGSGNIFTNGAAATAGFKRYIGGSNNIINTANAPQISGSMAFSPTMTQNYQVGATFIMRGPVSSSAWAIANNVIQGNVNIGSSAANHAEKLTSGLTMTSNTIAGTLSIIANQSALTGSTTTVTNNNINGVVTLNLSSSALTFNNNIINDGGFILTNQYFSTAAGLGQLTIQRNTILGNTHTIFVTGSLITGSTQPQLNDNFIGGANNTIYSDLTTSRISGSVILHSHYKSIMYGNGLIVTASATANDLSGHGSAFFGRYNSQDGNKNKPTDTVFAVGTGTSTTIRKTGFLIDSGSNSFFEGTVNISGSLLVNGIAPATISTGSFITTGSASTGSQTILGDFKFDTTYSGSRAYTSNGGGSNIVYIDYGDAYGNADFAYWQSLNFVGVTVNGTGVTNATVTSVGFGSYVEVTLSSGTVTNLASYTFTGPLVQTIDITGSLAVKQNITVTTVNGTATMADAGFSATNATFGGAYNAGITQLRNVNNNDIFQFAASSSAMYNGGGQWPGPQIATYQNDLGDATIIGFQTDSTWTDGRVTILRPLIAQSGSVVSGSLLVSGSSTFIGNQTITGSLSMSGSVNFATGSNKQAGTAVLNGGNPGVVTVSNSLVTANSIIMLTKQTLTNAHMVAVSAKSGGSFTITSNGNGDADTVGWMIINNS